MEADGLDHFAHGLCEIDIGVRADRAKSRQSYGLFGDHATPVVQAHDAHFHAVAAVKYTAVVRAEVVQYLVGFGATVVSFQEQVKVARLIGSDEWRAFADFAEKNRDCRDVLG